MREPKDSAGRRKIETKYALSHKQNNTELYYNGISKATQAKGM
jgi:hypothetical protein